MVSVYTLRMKLLLPTLLLACASGAQAAPHSLVVRISEGKHVYSHAMKIEEGGQVNYVGKPDGGEGRNMIVNMVLARAGARFRLEFQVELARADKSRSFQQQTAVEMRAGQSLTALECGDWKVEVVLDGKPGGAAPAGAEWSPAGLANYRLTTDLAVPAARRRCRQVMMGAGTQSNIVDSMTKDGRREDFILNSVLADPRGGAFDLQYRLKQTPLQAQSLAVLKLNRKSTVPADGGKINFLLEGALPAAEPAAGTAASPASVGGEAVPPPAITK